VAIDDRLDDIDYGDWTGLTRADVLARWPAEFALWLEAPNRLRIPGGERVAAARDRVWEAVCQLSSKRSAVVVVTHDACIRLAIVALLDAPLVSMHALRTDLTSITEFAFGAEGPQLTRVNDTSHLAGQPDDRPAR
jgi:broad specificity phosphatase PhoE